MKKVSILSGILILVLWASAIAAAVMPKASTHIIVNSQPLKSTNIIINARYRATIQTPLAIAYSATIKNETTGIQLTTNKNGEVSLDVSEGDIVYGIFRSNQVYMGRTIVTATNIANGELTIVLKGIGYSED